MSSWQPSASCDSVMARAQLLNYTRQYFAAMEVLEVETPLLCQAGVTDRYLEPLTVETEQQQQFLQTSPEYAMKRLLAAGYGDMYQICKAFRKGDIGRRHNPEFTILEWYRLGFDHNDLMDDVFQYLSGIFEGYERIDYSYQEVFQAFLGIDLQYITLHELELVAKQRLGELPEGLERDDYLSLLFEHSIEPNLGRRNSKGTGTIAFVHSYPASQAALARLIEHCDDDGNKAQVAARFEVYLEGVELANGFHELTDADEQRARFEEDNVWRVANGLPAMELDERFLDALSHGLPDCAGVALGLDRLLMIALDAETIDEVLAFVER